MAENKQYKFAQIQDPENCSIEELEKEVTRLETLGNFFETKQLALKKFINSVYGATASKYFLAYNLNVAESITLQGQHLNHYSENAVNEYFSGIFQNDVELHKKLGIKTEDAQRVTIDKGKLTETGLLEGPEFSYLKGKQSIVCSGDTDSISEDSILNINGQNITCLDLFNKLKKENNGIVLKLKTKQELVPVNKLYNVLSYIDHSDTCVYKPIKYIMRHKVNKPKYKIKTKSGKELILTGDHSVMVIRNNELISIKTKDIDMKIDKLITVNEHK